MSAPATPVRVSVASSTVCNSSDGGTDARPPLRERVNGVRTADTITISLSLLLLFLLRRDIRWLMMMALSLTVRNNKISKQNGAELSDAIFLLPHLTSGSPLRHSPDWIIPKDPLNAKRQRTSCRRDKSAVRASNTNHTTNTYNTQRINHPRLHYVVCGIASNCFLRLFEPHQSYTGHCTTNPASYVLHLLLSFQTGISNW